MAGYRQAQSLQVNPVPVALESVERLTPALPLAIVSDNIEQSSGSEGAQIIDLSDMEDSDPLQYSGSPNDTLEYALDD